MLFRQEQEYVRGRGKCVRSPYETVLSSDEIGTYNILTWDIDVSPNRLKVPELKCSSDKLSAVSVSKLVEEQTSFSAIGRSWY